MGQVLQDANLAQLRTIQVDMQALDSVAEAVVAQVRRYYPDLQVPPASVWRWLETGGIDRWAVLADYRGFSSPQDLLRVAGDLALLVSAAASQVPAGWVFEDGYTEHLFGGRAGVALAVLNMMRSGSFSADPADPLRVDAHALIRLDVEEVASGLRLDHDVFPGWAEALTAHLHRFGEAVGMRPDVFEADEAARPGNLLVQIGNRNARGEIAIDEVFARVAESFAPLWPGGAGVGDIILGDVWRADQPLGPAMIPFHLPALEMTNSLIEPFAWSGLNVSGFSELPAPSDAAHALLLQDHGVIRVISDQVPPDPVTGMIEVRMVTSSLWSRLADRVREKLAAPEEVLPNACVLEGSRMAAVPVAQENPEGFQKLAKIMNPGSVFWLPFGA
ncbi:hypothetical protein GCM10011316_31970 [Roseibium aquae]|uniref:DUF1688 family protein n=1 Tax=Roseibium aquae TaxID=1323746 RepID=A0A916TLP2_9HYPH|nr:hypothetical protein GCM10011316_31970 [Roseibium aquae]